MAEDIKVVKLRHPYKGHRGLINELKFRAPVYRDVMALGEPGVLVQTSEGARFMQEATAVIDEYAKRLLVDEDPLLMESASIADTLAIKGVVLDFFYSARSSLAETPPASSASSQAPSCAISE